MGILGGRNDENETEDFEGLGLGFSRDREPYPWNAPGILSRRNDEEGGNASWWFSSKKDSRFTSSGRCYGAFGGISEVHDAIKKIVEHLGVEPPDDIEYGVMKD